MSRTRSPFDGLEEGDIVILTGTCADDGVRYLDLRAEVATLDLVNGLRWAKVWPHNATVNHLTDGKLWFEESQVESLLVSEKVVS